MPSIGVIGAGAWGTALAQVFAKGGRDTTIWAREAEVIESINNSHENTMFLPDVALNENLKATGSLEDIAQKDIILVVTPAQFTRAMLIELKALIPAGKPVVICSKGVELDTGLLLSRVAEEVLPEATLAILTGPTFASEVARGLPCAVTIAVKTREIGQQIQDALGVKGFRPYITTDIIGAELGGAIKNVIAIACGIIEGRQLGESARAALVTRGAAEISRLAIAMGGQKETLLGMCGIGDLMLTCSSMQSRNFSLGVALGQGESLNQILESRKAVTEGVHTAKAALALAKRNAVDMPITEAVNKCLNEGVSIEDAIEHMLNRPFKYEMSGKK